MLLFFRTPLHSIMADPTDIRVPKGILKNKYNASSREPDILEKLNTNTYGSNVSRWEPPSQMGLIGDPRSSLGVAPVPVPAPQHGMNMPNPILDPVIRGIK